MESGKLVQWCVKPGDQVKRGDIVALVETDKGVIDVEVFASGRVDKLIVEPDTHVPVGAVLAELTTEAPATTSNEAQPPPAIAPPADLATAPVREIARPAMPTAEHGARRRISPAARARAMELGIDLESISASGPSAVITLEDVMRHASKTSEAVKEGQEAAIQGVQEHAPDMRRVIAKAMSRSKREIPHYYLSLTCSFASARSWLEGHNASASMEERLLPSALLVKAVALAARALPEFNGFYRDEEFTPAADVNVGMAIAMRGGRLVAPAILQADSKPLATVMGELRDLATRVRGGHMRGSELALPTITVTSLAEEGIDLIIPAIYPPQVAIVGFGSILERPWVVDGVVKPTPLLTMSLAADHRVTDGRAGARFLSHLRAALEAPESL
jgi:pyruvate dehydrogenase E2 component (dihydrolipoamide acetyltransferase)